MKNIITYSIFQLYKHKKITLITVAMVIISFCVLGYAVFDYYACRAGEYYAKDILEYDTEDIYRIDISKYIICNMGLENDIFNFYEDVRSIDDIKSCGAYYLDTDVEMGREVYVYGDVMEMFGIEIGEYESEKPDNSYIFGVDIADKYGMGNRYVSSFDGMSYIVSNVLPRDTEMLSGEMDAYGEIINLNDRVIIVMDNQELKELFFPMCLNNFYFTVDDSDDLERIIEEIHNIGEKNGIDINGIISLEHMFDETVRMLISYAGSTYLLPFVMFISATLGLVIASMISLMTNKRDSGIMIANGMTIREVSGMYFCENIIKVLLGLIVSLVYCSNKMVEEFGQYQRCFNYAICTFIMLAIFVVVISNLVICKYFRNKMPCALIGEVND